MSTALKISLIAFLFFVATGVRAESMATDPAADDTMIGPRAETPAKTESGQADSDDDNFEIKLVAPSAPSAPTASTPSTSSIQSTPSTGPSLARRKRPINEVAAEIDSLIEANLKAMDIEPAPVCDDPTFLRRVSLDLTGQIPSMQDLTRFINTPEQVRRSTKINELLTAPEYADHWASFWTTVLVGRAPGGFSDQAINRLRRWLYEHLKNNTPYDKVVEQLLTASGSVQFAGNPFVNAGNSIQAGKPADVPAVVYLGHHLQNKGLPETVGHVTRTFLGMRMGCAQCHDHPFDKWTQTDFWKLCAYLSDTNGSDYSLSDGDQRITYGTFEPPEPGLKFLPMLPGTAMSNFTEEEQPKQPQAQKRGGFSKAPASQPAHPLRGALYRQELAKWVIDLENSNFDRVAVNRIWKAMLGHGLVEPVDDLREKNPPTHPEVMELLAKDFSVNSRDLRRLISIIASTRAYQRSSFGPTTSGKDRLQAVRYAARADVRPMTPEMMFSAVLKVSGGESKAKTFLNGLNHTDAYNRRSGNNDVIEFYGLLQRFPFDGADEAAAANQFEGTVTFALTMMHSPLIQRVLRSGSINHSLESLFASALCRPPSKMEREAVTKLHSQDDLIWVLINSAEFVTMH